MSAPLTTSQTENQSPQVPTTSQALAVISTQDLLASILNELAETHQAHIALEQKIQALTMEFMNDGGPTFIVGPFKGDKKERAEEAITTWLGCSTPSLI